ncbi:unnamed protein product [Pleuronectes platessa]|uniref:Uncharacterized protein n=1 Tax=Pleuronectes platessa TaxID=8262 RepID=A0A9N7VPB2_PLEPL|nr:unnamed protein product [Pleuronectes platessa]
MAVCMEFPHRPQKGGLAERQRAVIVSGPGPPVPPRCPTVSQTIQCCLLLRPPPNPNPQPIYQASPSLLSPPTLDTRSGDMKRSGPSPAPTLAQPPQRDTVKQEAFSVEHLLK